MRPSHFPENEPENSGSRVLADTLKTALWAEPERHFTGGRVSQWYQRHVYGAIISRRLRRIRAWRNPEPWLTIQVVLEALRGEPSRRNYLRGEGLPGGITYTAGVEAIANLEFQPPFVYVAGYPRSGTTSLQNLVLRSFKSHIPPGEWNVPPHSLRLWWYPKHEVGVARDIADMGSELTRVFLAMRPLEEALASYSAYSGDDSQSWIESQIPHWFEMAEMASHPNVMAIPFSTWQDNSPRHAAKILEKASGVAASYIPSELTTWQDIHFEGTSPDMMTLPTKSHLPNDQRKEFIDRAKQKFQLICSQEQKSRASDLYSSVEERFAELICRN